jgi:hypothetical protein
MKTYLIHFYNCENEYKTDMAMGINSEDAKKKFLDLVDETVDVIEVEETFGDLDFYVI